MLIAKARFAFIFLFLAIGGWSYLQSDMSVAWPFIAAAAILLLSHFLFGNVWQAFRAIKKGQIKDADQILKQVKFPKVLVRRNRAYYYFSKGLLELQKKQILTGAEYINEALHIGLDRANDRAMAYLNLAHIAFVQEDKKQAALYAEKSLAENSSDLMIKEKIRELQKAL